MKGASPENPGNLDHRHGRLGALQIGHLAKKKTGHLANCEIPQMANVSEAVLLYTRFRGEIEDSLVG